MDTISLDDPRLGTTFPIDGQAPAMRALSRLDLNTSFSRWQFRTLRAPFLVLGFLAVTACGGGGGGNTPPVAPSYVIGGTVSGLVGTLAIQNNAGSNQSISSNGAFTANAAVANGTTYSVTVVTQPSGQTCSVANGSGTVNGGSVTNIDVTCTTLPNGVTLLNTTVSLDPSVPQSIGSAVAQVMSSAASGSLGGSISLPSTPSGGESIVFAVDANSDILLAALGTSSTTVLSADSTALALTRLLLGALPSTVTPTQIDQAIRGTTEYSHLVSLITTSIANGTSPVESAAVITSINIVTTQIPADVLSQLSAAKVPQQIKQVVSPSVTTQLPYSLLSWSGSSFQSVFATGADSSGNANIANGMSIAWSVASADASTGASLCLSGANKTANADCSVLVPRTSLLASIATSVTQYASFLNSKGVVAGNGSAFNLTLEQNQASRQTNVFQSVSDIVQVGLTQATAGLASSAQCAAAVTNAIISPNQVATIVGGTSASFSQYLTSLTTGSLATAILGGFKSCLSSSGSGWANSPAVLAVLVKFFQKIAGAVVADTLNVAKAANVGIEIGLTINYWDVSTQVGVCEANTTGAIAIVNCATQLQLAPATLVMAPTATVTPMVTALDATMMSTATPTDLQFRTSDAEVVGVDPTSGLITAELVIGDPAVTITATAQAEQASGSLSVTVVAPQISPPSASIQLNGPSVTFNLTDASGNAVILPPGVTWNSSDTGQLIVSEASSSSPSATTWSSSGTQIPGTVTITAVDPFGITYGTATLTVTDPPASLQVSPTSASTAVGSTRTFTVTATDSAGHSVVTPPNLQWTSSNPAVATVANGVATGVTTGTATIIVTDPVSTATASATVTVLAITLQLSPGAPTLKVGDNTTLTVTATDSSGPIATPPNLGWASSNPAVATVTGGVVTGVATGTATITATDPVSKASGTSTVTVTAAVVLHLSPASTSVTIGTTVDLAVTATDESGNTIATPANLQWSSSNAAAATVAAGVVTGVAAGSATITVTDPVSMATASAAVTVSAISLQISPASPSVAVGATTTLTVTASDASGTIATPPNLQWKSSQQGIASVISGIVTGVSIGAATITATDPVSLAAATITVVVALPSPGTAQSSAQMNVVGQSHVINTGCTNPARNEDSTTPINSTYSTPPPFFGANGTNFPDLLTWPGVAITSNPFTTTSADANYPLNPSTPGTAKKFVYTFSELTTTFTEQLNIDLQFSGTDFGDFNVFEDDTQVFKSVFDISSGTQVASYSFTRTASGTGMQSSLDAGCSTQVNVSYSGTIAVQYH